MSTPPPIESIATDIGCLISPTVSDTSTSSTISYTDSYASLPSNGPANHAHIIDLGNYVELAKDNLDGMLDCKLQDAAVTTLYNISPETLETFLSPTINTFKAVFGKKDIQLVIWRKGLEVLVSPHFPPPSQPVTKDTAKIGTFENHNSMKAFRFEHLAGYRIGYDGSWHLKVTACNAYCASKWPGVWAGKFEDHGGVTKMNVEAEEKDMEKRGSILAEYMLEGKFWELKAEVKTT